MCVCPRSGGDVLAKHRRLGGAYMFLGTMNSASPIASRSSCHLPALEGRPVGRYICSRARISAVGGLDNDASVTTRVLSSVPTTPVRMDEARAAISTERTDPVCEGWHEVDAMGALVPGLGLIVRTVEGGDNGPGVARRTFARGTGCDEDVALGTSDGGSDEVGHVSDALGRLSLDGFSRICGQVPAPAPGASPPNGVGAGTVLEQLFYPPCDDCIRRSAVDPLAKCKPTAAGCDRCAVLGQPCVRSLCPSFYEVRHAEVFVTEIGRTGLANHCRLNRMLSRRICENFRGVENGMAP